MKNTLTLPNYLHIGYSKAASTWFQEFLRKDEKVFLVYKSDFFFPLHSNKYNKGLQYYSRFFKGAGSYRIRVESHEHIILPFHHPRLKCASTNLEAVEMIARRIKDYLPGIKIVVIIRNQTDILLSRYTQYILQGGKAGSAEFLNKLVFTDDNYLKYMDYRYAKVIQLLYDIFGELYVLVLFQEELKHDPETFLDSLSAFFNHSFSYSPREMKKKKNVAPSPGGSKFIRFINRILVKEVATIEAKTRTRIPWIAWYTLVKTIRYLDRFPGKKKDKRTLFTPGEIKKIRDIFAEDNKNLSRLFNKPLVEYGYYYDE